MGLPATRIYRQPKSIYSGYDSGQDRRRERSHRH